MVLTIPRWSRGNSCLGMFDGGSVIICTKHVEFQTNMRALGTNAESYERSGLIVLPQINAK